MIGQYSKLKAKIRLGKFQKAYAAQKCAELDYSKYKNLSINPELSMKKIARWDTDAWKLGFKSGRDRLKHKTRQASSSS